MSKLTEAQADALLADWDSAQRRPRPCWRKNRKGNWVLRRAGVTWTVFESPAGSGWYKFCRAEDGKPARFSARCYRGEQAAREAAVG